jgi:hypothetical protein
MSGYASPFDRHHNTPSYIPSSSLLSSRQKLRDFVSDREDTFEGSIGRTASSFPPPVPAPGSGRMASAMTGGLQESVGRRTISSVPPHLRAPGHGRVVASVMGAKVEGSVKGSNGSVRRVVGPSAPPCVVPTPTNDVAARATKVEGRIGALEESGGYMAAALPPPPPTPTPTPPPTGGVRLHVSNEGGDLYVSPCSAIQPY